MKRFTIFLFIFLISINVDTANSQAIIGGDWRADVEAFAQKIIDAGFMPGMGIAITKDDWVIYYDGFGVTDVSTGRPVDEETRFYIASSTKALTATAVVLLAHEGRLDLDAPVTRYLPSLSFRSPLDANSISIEDLLTMTAGIEDRAPVGIQTAYTGQFTPQLLIKLLSNYGPAESGNSFDYSNLPYNILGLVLSKLAPGPLRARAWKEVVHNTVLEPLGMASTSAYRSQLRLDWLAMPHKFVPGKGFHRIHLAKYDKNLHAAGGYFASAHDLAKFVAAHASGGLLNGKQVFPNKVVEATHKLRAKQDRQFGPFHRFGWGYGWDLGTWEGKKIISRFGSFAGYYSHMSFLPKEKIGVVVLTNGQYISSIGANLMAIYIYDRLLGIPNLEKKYNKLFTDATKRRSDFIERLAKHLATERSRLEPLPHPLKAYAGTYKNAKLGTMVWKVIADGLEVRMGVARSRAGVYDASKSQLRVELAGGGDVVDFTFPENGGIAKSLEFLGYKFARVR